MNQVPIPGEWAYPIRSLARPNHCAAHDVMDVKFLESFGE